MSSPPEGFVITQIVLFSMTNGDFPSESYMKKLDERREQNLIKGRMFFMKRPDDPTTCMVLCSEKDAKDVVLDTFKTTILETASLLDGNIIAIEYEGVEMEYTEFKHGMIFEDPVMMKIDTSRPDILPLMAMGFIKDPAEKRKSLS